MRLPLPLVLTLALISLAGLSACSEPDAPMNAVNETALRATIDSLVAKYPDATVAVAVRDVATGTVLDREADHVFHAASTMKIPVMIEVYRQAEAGHLRLDDSLLVQNDFRSIVDSSRYSIEDDSDDALYERQGEPMAIRDLVFRMITVSSNLATNLLIETVTADSVQATAERLGVAGLRVYRGVEDLKAFRRGLNNVTDAASLATLLDALRRGEAVSAEADRAMLGILREQAFNTMIPAGLPAGTAVAHKTGWITGIHHDAALVFPADGPPYVLVILTEGIADERDSAALGAEIARAVHAVLRPAGR